MPIDLVETRALTVELSESQWVALCSVERDPIAYLKRQIRRRLEGEDRQIAAGSPTSSDADEY